jgi:hypothetical protein
MLLFVFLISLTLAWLTVVALVVASCRTAARADAAAAGLA